MTVPVLFAVAAAVNAGFQLTVTVLVYPSLARTPAADWAEVHGRHTRVITPLVAVVYGALAAAGVADLLAGPGPWEIVGLVLAGLTVLVTAVAAGPLHGRLDDNRSPEMGRLLRVDRGRCAFAVLAAAAATIGAVVR